MSVGPLERRWKHKPPCGTPVNWNHPLASGLVATIPLNEGGGLPFIYTRQGRFQGVGYNATPAPVTGLPSNIHWVSGPSGDALYFDASISGTIWFPDLPCLRLDNRGTIVFGAMFSVVSAGAMMFKGDGAATGNSSSFAILQIGLSSSLARPSMSAIGNAGLGSYGETVASSQVVWLNNFQRAGFAWSYNLAGVGSNAGRTRIFTTVDTLNTVDTTGENLVLGCDNAGALTYSQFAGRIEFVHLYSSFLDANSINRLIANPFAIFAPRTKRTIFTPNATTSHLLLMRRRRCAAI